MPLLCCRPFGPELLLTGGGSGHLIVWEGRAALRSVKVLGVFFLVWSHFFQSIILGAIPLLFCFAIFQCLNLLFIITLAFEYHSMLPFSIYRATVVPSPRCM